MTSKSLQQKMFAGLKESVDFMSGLSENKKQAIKLIIDGNAIVSVVIETKIPQQEVEELFEWYVQIITLQLKHFDQIVEDIEFSEYFKNSARDEVRFLKMMEERRQLRIRGAVSKDIYLKSLNLSARTINALSKAGVLTVHQLLSIVSSRRELLKFRLLGKRSADEVEQALHALGLNLGMKFNVPTTTQEVNV